MFKQTTLFSFESINTKNKYWKMAVDIPVHGEELLTLGWKKSNVGRVELKGRFASRILKSAKHHPESKKYSPLIKGFIKGWSQFIFLNDSLKKSGNFYKCDGNKCSLGKNSWEWSKSNGHVYVDYNLTNKEKLRFDFSNFEGDSARRVSISPIGQTLETTPFQLDLFIKECE
jgi:hypothetical protein